MSKLKESCPLLGATVDYNGIDYEVIGQKQRKGKTYLIGRPFGSSLTYWLNPAKVQVLSPSFN